MGAFRVIYRYWVALVFVAVLAQVAAAGYGAFYTSEKSNEAEDRPVAQVLPADTVESGFGFHNALGPLVFFAAIILLVLALVGRIDRRRVVWTLVLTVVLLIQFVLAVTGRDVPVVGALHAFNALVIVAISGALAGRAWRRDAIAAGG